MMNKDNFKLVFKDFLTMLMIQISELCLNNVDKFLTLSYSQDQMGNQRALLLPNSEDLI
jgi:hypothetical protein